MSTLGDIKAAIEVLCGAGMQLNMLKVLHCTTEYPTPMNEVNLAAMQTIKKEFGVEVGYSDHTKGIEVAIAAVALGAKSLKNTSLLIAIFPALIIEPVSSLMSYT